MYQPVFVAGTFADLENAVRDLCMQIDEVARHVPDEDREYAAMAKENLWKMYDSAHKHALARTGLER